MQVKELIEELKKVPNQDALVTAAPMELASDGVWQEVIETAEDPFPVVDVAFEYVWERLSGEAGECVIGYSEGKGPQDDASLEGKFGSSDASD